MGIMWRLTFFIFLQGLRGLVVPLDATQTEHMNIQELDLRTYEGKEAECIDMKARSLEYCLELPNIPASTPLRCYMDGEFVLECNTNETDSCEDHGSLDGKVKHPNLKSSSCPFLQFFIVEQEILHHHYVCCSPTGTYHLYLQPCTDFRSPPPLPKEYQQICGHQKQDTTEPTNTTMDVPEGEITEADNNTSIKISSVVGGAVFLALLLLALIIWRGKRDQKNNMHSMEEGNTNDLKGNHSKEKADQESDAQESEPLSANLEQSFISPVHQIIIQED